MPRGWFSGPGIGVLDARYLMLDCTNDPLTAGLEVNAATAGEPVCILQTTDDNATNPILEVQNAAGAMLSEVQTAGNLNFAAAVANSPGMIEVNNVRFMHTYGTENAFVGELAGNQTLTAQGCAAFGYEALLSLTNGDYNFALGVKALRSTTTGFGNVAVGWNAMRLNINGYRNMAMGTEAMYFNTSGFRNVALGIYSGFRNVSGDDNTMIGFNANRFNMTGNKGTIIGFQAGYGAVNQSHSNNTFVGYKAGFAITTGGNNILLGYQAGDLITAGASNIIIGYDIDPTGAGVSSELNIGGLLYGALAANRGGINVTPPNLLATWHVDQPVDDAAIPVLILDQADISEGFINFIGSDRGVITGATNSVGSVRAEINGVVYRLALYADA